MAKGILHTFGDSFAWSNTNWVKHIERKGNYIGTNINAVGGSSLYHLLVQLEENKHKIKEEDGVIICLTQHIRRLFKGHHFLAAAIDKGNPHYDDYVKHFFDYRESTIFGAAIVDSIIGIQIPKLNTSNVAYFYSVDKEVEEFSSLPPDPYPAIWQLVRQFIDSQDKDFNIEYIKIKSPNHWVDDPLYEELFFSTYKNKIDKLVNR